MFFGNSAIQSFSQSVRSVIHQPFTLFFHSILTHTHAGHNRAQNYQILYMERVGQRANMSDAICTCDRQGIADFVFTSLG